MTAGASTTRVAQALDRLARLHPRKIDLSLGRIDRLLGALGRPERRLPPVLHVAGTNGKGSVVAFSRSVLEAAGARVHTYTSPHLVRFNERIRLAGALIGDDALADLLDRVEAANDGAQITYFEVTTAAAFLAFAEVPADWLVLEVGLGGRWDATNVVAEPAAAAVTVIGLDHQAFLGDDILGIAREKAGVFKPGRPAVIAPQDDPAVAACLLAEAVEVGAVPMPVAVPEALPPLGLAGAHQNANAATALALLRAGGAQPTGQEVADGLAAVSWPARLQRLDAGKLARALPAGWGLVLDGGHNPSAGGALRRWAAETADGRPLAIVAGMLDTKDRVGFLAPLAAVADRLTAVPVPAGDTGAGLPPETLAQEARRAGFTTVGLAADVPAALAALAAQDPAPRRVLVCGSLYLAGAVLAADGTIPT